MGTRLDSLFDIEYPKQLIFKAQVIDENGINFVSSRGRNGGVVAKVVCNPEAKVYNAGAITVPLKGSVLHAHLQISDFHCAHQTAVLFPKSERKLTTEQLVYYVLCIRRNKFRYSYGRQADRTLPSLIVPNVDEIPSFVKRRRHEQPSQTPLKRQKVEAPVSRKLGSFPLWSLFEIKKGQRLTKAKLQSGPTPFVASISSNNGVRQRVSALPNHRGGTISVNYNGSVGEAFYQPVPFYASDDVCVLYPRFEMTPLIALFLTVIIRAEKFRFSFGRKWNLRRMKETEIQLPVLDGGDIDFNYIEEFMSSLPYSSNFKNHAMGRSEKVLMQGLLDAE